ncbi:hypothetical protein HXX76_003995 [Chlamydomonas incerta]|uniref:Protein kinase domain-containing protein n=1 Tax=Chlamydomonas incerta TaxID=51695 RepID=A0A835T9K7_CHLIN|nr:hypothetical protein HXX76_003995 [Chlamydomonas incerta]|eukprot:KAG2441143.1 hypothetical protein HXX76_003995 [Chlamydomonas incerta]
MRAMGMLTPSAPGAASQVVFQAGAVVLVMPADQDWSWASTWWFLVSTRAADYPGWQTARFLPPRTPADSNCSLDVAARPTQRCWAMQGYLYDVVYDAMELEPSAVASTTLVPSALSASSRKFYTIHLLSCDFFFGEMSTTRTTVQPINNTGVEVVSVPVGSGYELAAALVNASVAQILVTAPFVNVTDADFEALGVSLPLRLDRNVSVTAPADQQWPLLTLRAVKKMSLGPNVTLRFTGLAIDPVVSLYSFRSASVMPMVGRSSGGPPGAGSTPRIVIDKCALVPELGLEGAKSYAWLISIPRPETAPGMQILNGLGGSPANCSHDGAAPPLQRCWASNNMFVDVAASMVDVDSKTGVTTRLNYDVLILDTTVHFNKGIPEACMDAPDPVECYFRLSVNTSAVTLTGTAAAPTDTATWSPPPAAGSQPGGSSSGSASLGIIVGCVVGGVGALIGVAVVAAVLRRRRRASSGGARQSAYEKPGLTGASAVVDVHSSNADGEDPPHPKNAALTSATGPRGGQRSWRLIRTGGAESSARSSSPACSGIMSTAGDAATGSSGLLGTGNRDHRSPMQGGAGGIDGESSGLATQEVSSPAFEGSTQHAVPAAAAAAAEVATQLKHLLALPTGSKPPPLLHPNAAFAAAAAAGAVAVVPTTPFRRDLNINVQFDVGSPAQQCAGKGGAVGNHGSSSCSATASSTPPLGSKAGAAMLAQPADDGEEADAQQPAVLAAFQPSDSAAAAAAAAAATCAAGVAPDGNMRRGTIHGRGGAAAEATSATPHDANAAVQLLPRVLGKGAFGRVVEGRFKGERVAVKLLLMDRLGLGLGGGGLPSGAAAGTGGGSGHRGQDQYVLAFVREVEILGRIDHANVVRLLAASVEPPRLALVMELMDCSLERVLFGAGPGAPLLPLPKLLHIAIQIAQGLAYLHPTVLHKDLKPGNVLLRGADSDTPDVKLSDFGLSSLRMHTVPTLNAACGTPAYMAPELFDPETTTVTHHADMYSFGVLLWAMLAGKQPWQDFSMVALAYQVSLGARLPLQYLGEGRCPAKLRELITACWDADPLRRPAAAEVVIELLLIKQQAGAALLQPAEEQQAGAAHAQHGSGNQPA